MPRDDDDDRPRSRKGKRSRRKDRPGFFATFGIVFGVGIGIGLVVLAIVLAVNKGQLPGSKEREEAKLPEGTIDARGFGTKSQDVGEKAFDALDRNVKLKDVVGRFGGEGKRIPKDRHKDVQFTYMGKTSTLADFTKEGFDRYQWFAWTNGSETLLLGFNNSDPHFLRAKVYFGYKGLAFKSVD
jgi:hypothetical protein